MTLKITIITVCYNSEETIEDTIRSVISQDYADIEYIIVDGKSSDGTIDIIKKYSDQIDIIISESDKGIYDAMNKGIGVATGDVIGILNSDDIFSSATIISDVAELFKNNPDLDAVYGNISYFLGSDHDKNVRVWETKPYYDKFFDDGEVPPHPSLFVKKNVYDAIGTYFPDFRLSSDYEFMFRAFKVHKYKPYYLNKLIVRMRAGGESTKSIRNLLIGNKEVSKAWAMNNFRPPLKFWFLRVTKKLFQFAKR